MSRLLLLASVVGFAVVLWSFLASAAIRPTPFSLLTNDLDAAMSAHHFSAEEKELISLRVSELQKAHTGEVHRYGSAFFISFFGLLAFSFFALVASFLIRSRA